MPNCLTLIVLLGGIFILAKVIAIVTSLPGYVSSSLDTAKHRKSSNDYGNLASPGYGGKKSKTKLFVEEMTERIGYHL